MTLGSVIVLSGCAYACLLLHIVGLRGLKKAQEIAVITLAIGIAVDFAMAVMR